MGPLEKLKAFGIEPRLSDIPLGVSSIYERIFPQWGDHVVSNNVAAEQFYNENAKMHTPEYNRAKSYYGTLDYMLRSNRSKEDAERLARYFQLKQALFRDPKQDLIDLDANLAGITAGNALRGYMKPVDSPLDDNWEDMLELARTYAKGVK